MKSVLYAWISRKDWLTRESAKKSGIDSSPLGSLGVAQNHQGGEPQQSCISTSRRSTLGSRRTLIRHLSSEKTPRMNIGDGHAIMRFHWRKDVRRRGRRSSSALCLRGIGARSLSRPADLRPRVAVFAGASPRVVGVGALHLEEIVDVGVHLAGEPADGFEVVGRP